MCHETYQLMFADASTMLISHLKLAIIIILQKWWLWFDLVNEFLYLHACMHAVAMMRRVYP